MDRNSYWDNVMSYYHKEFSGKFLVLDRTPDGDFVRVTTSDGMLF